MDLTDEDLKTAIIKRQGTKENYVYKKVMKTVTEE